MNANELALMIGVHPDSIRRLIRNGDIKAIKNGRSYEIESSEVERIKDKYGSKNNQIVSELTVENKRLKEEIKHIKDTLKELL